MKNYALRWGLVVSLLLTMFTLSAGAAASDTMPTAPTCAHYTDGSAGIHGEGWTALSTAQGNFPKLEGGKYYLTQAEGFAAHPTKASDGSGAISIYGDVVLCLNGKTIFHKQSTSSPTVSVHLFSLQPNASLTICDCSAEKTGTISKTYGNAGKAVFIVRDGCTLNVFDADLKDCATDAIVRTHGTTATSSINFVNVDVTGYSDSLCDTTSNFAPFHLLSKKTFNLYNCKIVNPTFDWASNVTTGLISVPAGATVNMENTTISGVTNTSSTVDAVVCLDGSNARLNMFGTSAIKDNVDGAGCGSVYVKNGATFEMHGGTISGNVCTAHGGAVRIAGNGIFNMYGGTIENNEAANNAGGVMVNGTFNMYNGTIKGNKAKGANFGGGGVAVSAGTFTMEGGTIEENKATSTAGLGGGVRVYGTGKFIMKGESTIQNNESAQWGGGVSVDAGTSFTMENGTITGNSAAKRGGAVYTQGDVTINNGDITDNTAESWVGRSVAVVKGNFTVNGGKIFSNTYEDIVLYTTVAGDTANVTLNGGTFGYLYYLPSTINGTVNVAFNGGFYPKQYTEGVQSDVTTANGSVTYTIADGLEFKDYGTGYKKFLLAAAYAGTNMKLGETLNVMFNFGKAGAVPTTAVATIGDREVTASVDAKTVDGVEAYVVTVPGVAATEMSEIISVELKDAKGNVINAASDSIKAYGERVLAVEANAAAHTVIVDMLNYGAAAQQYFGMEVTMQTLANAGIADYQTKATDIGTALADAQADSSISFAGSRAYSYANLTLDDMVDFNLYFWVDQIGEENKTYTYSVNDGAAKPGTFSEYLDADQENPVLYTLKVENLTIADLAEAKVTVTFYEKGQEKTITDSVFNYLARTDGASKFAEDGKDNSGLSQYLVAFAASAKEYAGDPDLGENETPIG